MKIQINFEITEKMIKIAIGDLINNSRYYNRHEMKVNNSALKITKKEIKYN